MNSEALVLGTSAGLFIIGALGALLHRHPVVLLMAVEVMLNAGNVLLVSASRIQGTALGQGVALIVLVLSAAEVVVGLGLALALFRNHDLPDIDTATDLQG
jgi:NADH-quinone oxidoreductase subunit K